MSCCIKGCEDIPNFSPPKRHLCWPFRLPMRGERLTWRATYVLELGWTMVSNFVFTPRAAARRASFSVVVAATVAFAIPANAKGGGWPKCHGADPEGRIAGCSQVIERIAKETSHNKIAAYFMRAVAYQIKGDYDHAVEDFGKALEIDPKSSVILSAR